MSLLVTSVALKTAVVEVVAVRRLLQLQGLAAHLCEVAAVVAWVDRTLPFLRI